MKLTLSLCALLIWLVSMCTSMDRYRNKICYRAKTCIHNAREKCGKDSHDHYRRFYDSCDILEFNCLRGTDYMKTKNYKCRDLPRIDDYVQGNHGIGKLDHVQESTIQKKIDINNGKIQGKINFSKENIEENAPAVAGGAHEASNQDTPAIKGEINIDQDKITGDITINENIADTVNKSNETPEIPAVEGEIELNEDGIAGSVVINENIKLEAKPTEDKSKQEIAAIEGKVEIEEDKITGSININDNLEDTSRADTKIADQDSTDINEGESNDRSENRNINISSENINDKMNPNHKKDYNKKTVNKENRFNGKKGGRVKVKRNQKMQRGGAVKMANYGADRPRVHVTYPSEDAERSKNTENNYNEFSPHEPEEVQDSINAPITHLQPAKGLK